MSNNGDTRCYHCCCRKQPQCYRNSTFRYRLVLGVQVLYVLLLITTTLYFCLPSLQFNNVLHNNVTRSAPAVVVVDASVQRVVHIGHHNIDVATRPVHPSKASSPTPTSSTSTTSPTPTTTTTSPTSSTPVVPPLLTAPVSSSLPTHIPSFLDTASSTAAISDVAITSSTSQTWPTSSRTLFDQYVSFHGGFADGRRLGNQMFNLAAVIHVARLTGRQPAILKFKYKIQLDEVFDLNIERFDDLCPCYVYGENQSLVYDSRLEQLGNGSHAEKARGKSILLSGFFQSWKYTLNVEHQLHRRFTFLQEIREFVHRFLADSRPPGWVDGYVRVAVHARRGDQLNAEQIEFGLTTPDQQYFAHAMRHFVDRFDRIQFIVASDDINWCRQNLMDFATTLPHRINVTFLTPHSSGEDLAILSSCQHVIISTGSYGWWAAWLANGTTIYYADWPRNGSKLDKMFKREDYFPPTWIGMT